MTDDKRPACDGEYELFWELMDSPANFGLRREAAKFCGTCPIRDECLPKHIGYGGADREWAVAIVKELSRPKSHPCEWCGQPMELKPRAGKRRQYCDDTCGHLARAAARGTIHGDIPQEIRGAHAFFVRLRNAGTPIEDIPPATRAGESDYQARCYKARKAQQESVA